MQVRFHGVREVSSLAGDPHPLRPPAHPTKQTPSTNQKSTAQTTPTTYRNKPHQQTRNQQFHQILEPTKQTPSTNQKSTVQTKPEGTGFTSFEKVHTLVQKLRHRRRSHERRCSFVIANQQFETGKPRINRTFVDHHVNASRKQVRHDDQS